MTEPSILEWLKGGLGWVDLRHDAKARLDPNLDGVDLTASIVALDHILDFLARCDIDSEALARLHIALVRTWEGSAPTAMLTPRSAAKKLSDSVAVQIVKGGLAAVMEMRKCDGAKLLDAAQWVIDHVSSEALRLLANDPRQVTAQTVVNWRQRFGTRNAKGHGRESYLRVLKCGRSEMAEGKPDAALQQLRSIEDYAVRRLPASERSPCPPSPTLP